MSGQVLLIGVVHVLLWGRSGHVLLACRGRRCVTDTGLGKQIGFSLWDRDGDS